MTTQRKIIHIDMDCFYAAIEMRENPSLIGKPVAVGGMVKHRGVLATCNYEARRFGLHSAMSTAQALKRCPKLILIPPNMPLYQSVSEQIHHIFRRYTELIEPLSLDEAYLDVTNSHQCSGSATWIAKEIRDAIWKELHLPASAGIAPLKFLAKIASAQNKPNGQFVIPPENMTTFIHNLLLQQIPGVGKVTNKKLMQLGLYTCSDIQQSDKTLIYKTFGKFGQRLWEFSHGIDNRQIEVNRPPKSLTVEHTLPTDIWHLEQAEQIVDRLCNQLLFRLQRNGSDRPKHQFKKLGIKLKFSDFTQTTLERTTDGFSSDRFIELLQQIWQRTNNRSVRLIGLSVHYPTEKVKKQLNLWE